MATQTQTMPDLWPDDIGQETGELGPATLLKSQAALLSDKTKGLVTAEVRGGQDSSNGKFVDSFYLVGPTINYQYLLFSLFYPIEFYPAMLIAQEGVRDIDVSKTVNNDAELTEEISKIFGSEKTKNVINAIIARSK